MNIFLTIPGCISRKGLDGMGIVIYPRISGDRYQLFICLSDEHKKGRVIPNWLTLL